MFAVLLAYVLCTIKCFSLGAYRDHRTWFVVIIYDTSIYMLLVWLLHTLLNYIWLTNFI